EGVYRGKTAQEALVSTNAGIVEVAGAKSAERDFGTDLGIGGEISGLIPITRRCAVFALLDAAGGGESALVLGAPEGSARARGRLGGAARGTRGVALTAWRCGGRDDDIIGVRRNALPAWPLRELVRQKICEGSDVGARKARFLLHSAARKEDIEAEEIE